MSVSCCIGEGTDASNAAGFLCVQQGRYTSAGLLLDEGISEGTFLLEQRKATRAEEKNIYLRVSCQFILSLFPPLKV